MSQDFQVNRENSLPNTQIHNDSEQHRVAEAQLDEMVRLSAKTKSAEYFIDLQEENYSVPVKDKMARLAQILAQKNLQI